VWFTSERCSREIRDLDSLFDLIGKPVKNGTLSKLGHSAKLLALPLR